MARFRYSMENILRIKERLEEQKRMELGQAMVVLQAQQNVQLALEHKLQNYLDDFYSKQKRVVNGAMLQNMSKQVAYYEGVVKKQKTIVVKAQEDVGLKREVLKKALEERKIQEKLKEKALEYYIEEQKLKEQQTLDEIVGYRYATDEESRG